MPQPDRRPRRLGARPGEAGSATLEYIAALALLGLLVGALTLPMLSAGTSLKTKVCEIYATVAAAGSGAGAASCGTTGPTGPTDPGQPTQPPFDPKPAKCKVGEHGEKVNSEIKIAFVKLGENAGFVETTYSDGTVTYTATDGASIGLTGGFGGKLDIGKVERGAKVDFGGDFKVDYGSTWVFKNADEAAKMRKQLDDYLAEQEIIKHDPMYAIKFLWSDPKEPPKPPQQTVSTIEVAGSVEGKVGLSLPWKQDPGSTSGVPNLALADFGLKFGGSEKWTQITDNVAGTKTYTTTGEGYGQVNGTVGPYAGELKGVLGSSMSVTRDKDNQVTKITLTTTREGKATSTVNFGQKDLGGKGSDADSASHVTVSTASLDVSTPEQRALADAWLAEQASDPDAYVSPETFYPDKLVDSDPFQNLMYTNATVSNVQYDNVSDKQGFAAEVKVGIALGVDFSLETSDSKAVDATYLGAPAEGGTTRAPVDFPECLAK
ncbi:hypothetical protein [Microlunatus flavus]|uniref:Uncharacterized protein n=1 Tax=Microlunatus flavus TaxID=1036181 RepID=A0A1H9A0P3_9ACTN|nr:hypothetical protein [Microlunatus flavus]SEP70175.1 hypothetical protein SAMN05421756_101430 [Microlunatus flavus]